MDGSTPIMLSMELPFIIGIHCGDAPAIPLLVRAESPQAALEGFASRSQAQILASLEDDLGDVPLAAAVVIDRKTYSVTVRRGE
jgi:hypothetical protein